MILDDGSTPITLPDALEWVDEFDWSPVGQNIAPTIGGGQVISEASISKGRPITLVGGDGVWVERSVVNAIFAALSIKDKSYQLIMPDGRVFTVMFDRRSQAMETRPVWRKNTYLPTDKFTLSLKFLEV